MNFSSPIKNEILNFQQVKEAAFQLRENWNIGVDGIVNVIDLLEEQGIKILEIDASDSFDGLSSMVNDEYPVIVLNKSFSSERKRFTALHELGHLVLSFSKELSEKDEAIYPYEYWVDTSYEIAGGGLPEGLVIKDGKIARAEE